VLDGFTITTEQKSILPARVCAQHLSALGAQVEQNDCSAGGGEQILRLSSTETSPLARAVDCAIAWHPNHREQPGNEALIQAISGLMAVHGRDRSTPRRLGLEVASVAAGIVATQGVLVALIAQSRGQQISGVQTSVLEAALMFLYHHFAIATCGGNWPFRPLESGKGPPFATADGHWVELEVMTGESWKTFWAKLGVVEAKVAGSAWLPYVYRYLAGSCALPVALHDATRRLTLAELRHSANESGVTVGTVRSYDDLLHEVGLNNNNMGSFEQNRRENFAPPWTIEPRIARVQTDQRPWIVGNAPLAGIQVVEVTSRLQGPLAGLLLQMLGAEVLKVEPLGGDFGRFSPPLAGSIGAAYLAYNRDKQILEIDYKRPEGRAQLTGLAAGADVFLHNWKSGRAEELGLDFEHLLRRNPRLIYAHASAWGQMDEEPSPIAGDFLVQAYAACGDGLNPVGEPPFPSRLTLLDVTGGLLACEGILAGLYGRERYGYGCRVQTSLLSAAMSLQSEVLTAIATNQETGRLVGRPLWGWLDQPLETGEGFIMVCREDAAIEKHLLDVCNIDQSTSAANISEQLIKRLRAKTAAGWNVLFRRAQIPCAVCTNPAQLSEDSEIQGLLQPVDGACCVPAAPWHFETVA
jgi:CoA:oxalate CoA-transferase